MRAFLREPRLSTRSIVVALGGNALAPGGEEGTIAQQFAHTRESLAPIVELAAEGWQIAIVHGNGPQVGNAMLQQELARHLAPPLPLGVLVAATQGWIGYMIQQSLQNALLDAGVDRQVVTLVTQMEVDRNDPELLQPSKPIGRTVDGEAAHKLADELGWEVAQIGEGWRRVVPSPHPVRIVEGEMIRTLVRQGTLVIAAGGGGTPVYADRGRFEGIDAVVDKDRAAAVLGRELGAEVLLILTDVEAVYSGYGTPNQKAFRSLSIAEAEALMETGELGSGSMAPKVGAAIEFIRTGGRRSIISRLEMGRQAVLGLAGTEITAG